MFEVAMRIEKPPATVFSWLEDIRSIPSWYAAVRAVEPLSPGPAGRHSRYTLRREIAGQEVENTVEVTEFVEGERLTLSSLSGPTPFTYRYRVAPDGTGTRLRLIGTISGVGLVGPLALLRPLASRFSRWACGPTWPGSSNSSKPGRCRPGCRATRRSVCGAPSLRSGPRETRRR